MVDYDYSRQGDLMEIVIRDSSHRKIEQFKCNLTDKKLCRKIFSIIERKYGFVDIEIPHDKSINVKKENNVDWLDMDNEFFK